MSVQRAGSTGVSGNFNVLPMNAELNNEALSDTPDAPTITQPKPDAFKNLNPDLAKTIGAVASAVGEEPSPKKVLKGGAKGVTAAAAQAKKDDTKLKDMKQLLKSSTTGAAAVKYLEDKKIPVKFANGGGSYWDGKQIVIDRTQSTEEAALTLVHEMNHAEASQGGTTGNITTQPRADYVKTMLSEEVKGTVDSIKAKNELVAAGKKVTATFPLEAEYNAAYNKAVDDCKKANPKASAADLTAAGEKAGYDRVMKGFKDAEVTTSTTHERYSDYYGNAWDKAHPPAKK